MAKRDRDIKEGFDGMNFGNKSKLFHEMPEYRSRTQQSRNTKQESPKKKVMTESEKASEFLDKNCDFLRKDLSSEKFNKLIKAVVSYKKNL
jgi:hypothetical protein